VKDQAAGITLKRRLGLFPAMLVGVGVILGAGIYVLVGVGAGRAGNAVWLSFLIGAVVAGLTGLSYARLHKLRPKNAPEFQYLSMAFGRVPGFLGGWLVLWAAVVSSAAVALGFGGYLQHLAGVPVLAGAVGLILVSSVVVFLGVGESAILAGIFTLIEVGGLLFIIIIGVPSIGRYDLVEMPLGISGVIGGASLIFFAYLGFEGMANLSEEMKNAEKDLPRALLLSLGITSVFYVLVSISAVSAVGWEELSASGAPLATVASGVLGSRADLVLTLIALTSTANTVLLMLFAASRASWAMACAGVLPVGLCVVGKRRQTPWFATIIVGIFAALFAIVRSIEHVAEFTNFATLLTFAGVNAAAFWLLRRNREGGGAGRVLKDMLLPALGVITALWLATNAGWRAALFGVGLIVVGVAVYFVMRRLSIRPE
jgi:APA family basic amino acid/polyamine antiporter